MSAGTIVQVDPKELVIALNVRTDVKVDKEFVASIKTLGILQPPMVTITGDGEYEVVLGQRRTLAAVEAGLTSIPVYVVEQSEADAARVIDQLTENDQRQGLSEAERVAGYKQLSLFGLSPAQIVKKTSRPKAVIEKALAVADNETASTALAEYELTLDQAAYLVEFSEDPEAVEKLVAAAAEGRLSHVVASLREKRDLEAAVVEQEELLKGIVGAKKVLPFTKQSWIDPAEPAGLVALTRLGKPSDPTEPAEPQDVPKKALYGQVIVTYQEVEGTYKNWPSPRFYVLDPEANGIPTRDYVSSREMTPEEKAAEEERQARWAAEREERAALDAAHAVRREWLRELLQRKSLPDDALAFLAKLAVVAVVEVDNAVVDLLNLSLPKGEDVGEAWFEFIAESPSNPMKVLFAAGLAAAEDYLEGWGSSEIADWYLPQLVAWGYGLSEAEQGLLTEPESDGEGGDV